MRKIDVEAFARLGQMNQDAVPTPPQRKSPPSKKRRQPKLNEGAQQELYHCTAKYILAWSEKGSGKTWGGVEKLVEHCIKWTGALAAIVVATKGQATKGGAWDNLLSILKKRKEENPEFWYSDVKIDSQGNETIYIEAERGGLSQVILISCPYSSQIASRMPGAALSFAFVDELDKTDGPEYFKAVAAQIGRRPGIPGDEQQYVGACNPAGPSHWVYLMWFVDCVIEATGELDPNYHNIYFPADANRKNMPKGYFEGLASIYRNDPIARARMIGGEWIDKASGDSIFGGSYDVQHHVRPLDENNNPDRKRRLLPDKAYPLIIGIDSGSTHHSFSILQRRPVDGKMKWVVIDEVVVIKRQVTYGKLIPVVMRRIQFWFKVAGCKSVVAISDTSAFNMFRPGSGSFDYMDMERHWNAQCAAMGLPRLKIKSGPKFDGSVDARITCLLNALGDLMIVISASCVKHQAMLMMLESQKASEPGESSIKIKRSKHIHVFDSLTYVLLVGELKPYLLAPTIQSTQQLIEARN